MKKDKGKTMMNDRVSFFLFSLRSPCMKSPSYE